MHWLRGAWRTKATLVPLDLNAHDNFGHSVSLHRSYVAAGAPSKEVDGVPEQHSLRCRAPSGTSGYFTLTFQDFRSQPIFGNDTALDIRKKITGTYGDTDNIHTIWRASVVGDSGWDGVTGGIISGGGNQVLITYLTPNGSGLSTQGGRTGDIEEMGVDDIFLTAMYLM